MKSKQVQYSLEYPYGGGPKRNAGGLASHVLPTTPEPSKLATPFATIFRWGRMFVPEVQTVAALVEEDVPKEHVKPEISVLVSLGSRGQCPGNLRRTSNTVCVPVQKGHVRKPMGCFQNTAATTTLEGTSTVMHKGLQST